MVLSVKQNHKIMWLACYASVAGIDEPSEIHSEPGTYFQTSNLAFGVWNIFCFQLATLFSRSITPHQTQNDCSIVPGPETFAIACYRGRFDQLPHSLVPWLGRMVPHMDVLLFLYAAPGKTFWICPALSKRLGTKKEELGPYFGSGFLNSPGDSRMIV